MFPRLRVKMDPVAYGKAGNIIRPDTRLIIKGKDALLRLWLFRFAQKSKRRKQQTSRRLLSVEVMRVFCDFCRQDGQPDGAFFFVKGQLLHRQTNGAYPLSDSFKSAFQLRSASPGGSLPLLHDQLPAICSLFSGASKPAKGLRPRPAFLSDNFKKPFPEALLFCLLLLALLEICPDAPPEISAEKLRSLNSPVFCLV